MTLEDDYIESVWWSLRKLWDDGRLYEGHKVVPYCPRCGTALSSHEVALGYKDVEDPSIYVRFPLPGGDDGEAGESLLVWTTTPWTLPGNVAVAVAPDVTYVRAMVDGKTLILAEPLVEKVLGEGVEIVDRFPGSDLVGRRYRGPVFELEDGGPTDAFRVLAGDFVTTEDGTGIVHIAPAFGEDDYAVAAANGIFDPTRHATLYNPVGLDGKFDRRVVGFEGRFVKDPEVTETLIADLDRRGLLFRAQVYEHAYPHCWRCGTPLLYYAKSSWYVAHLAGARSAARQATSRSAGTRSTSSTAASANGWRTTSTGRSRATATGARRCRSGSARARAATAASAPARSPSCASAPRARSPTTCTAPTSTRSRSSASAAAARCAGSTR